MIFEKIRERLQKAESVKCYGSLNSGNLMIPLADAISIVEQAETEYNNGWIPCSERLPEDCSSVICSLKLKNKAMYSINALWYNRELKKWCDIETDEPFVEKLFEVTAWQPLPEPYKPREEQPTEPDWKSSVMNHFAKGE